VVHHHVELHKAQVDAGAEDKTMEETNNKSKKKNNMVPIAIIIIAIIVIAIVLKPKFAGEVTGNSVKENDNSGSSNSKIVEIPLSDISDQAEFYEYEGIEYFVVQASNGDIKTAFNACDVCYKSKKGYRQEGIDMVCNNCGNHYPIAGLGTKNLGGGGCWPGYLPSEVQGDNLVIKISDIQKGAYRF